MRATSNSRSERQRREYAPSRAQRFDSLFSQMPKIRIWIERALLASGLLLVAIYAAARIESYVSSKLAIDEFTRDTLPLATDALAETAQPLLDEPDEPLSISPEIDFGLWSKKRIDEYRRAINIGGRGALAVLEIPRIDLEVPVFEGTDDLTLNRGAGRIAGTSRPGEAGNIGIAAHRDSFFRGLKKIQPGDAIRLRTRSGAEMYNVDHIEVVRPDDVRVLEPRPQPSLTLVTCYPFYYFGSAPQRYIVSASLSERLYQPAVDVGSRFTNSIQKGETP